MARLIADRIHEQRRAKCPPGMCQTCFYSRYRILLADACVCTGHVEQGVYRLPQLSNQTEPHTQA